LGFDENIFECEIEKEVEINVGGWSMEG